MLLILGVGYGQKKRTKISERLDLFGYGETVLVVDHGSLGLGGFFVFIVIVIIGLFTQIALQGNEHEFDAGAVFGNLGHPFGLYVFE
jgi:hypothetical protein